MKQAKIDKIVNVFNSEFGRNPTSLELNTYSNMKPKKITNLLRDSPEYYGMGRGGGGGSSSAKTSAVSGVDLSGGGGVGEPQANLTIAPLEPAKRPDPMADLGLDSALNPEAMAALDSATIDSLMSMQSSASKVEDVAGSYLKGEVPADVQAQIRRLTSERGLASGLGRGQAGKALTARDIGLTSFELTSKGTDMATAASAMRESVAKISEARRSFDKNFALQSAELADVYKRTDIDANRLEAVRRQFNAETNMKLVGMLADFASSRAKLQVDLARADMDSTNVIGGIEQVMSQLQSLIGKSSLEA